MSFFILGESGFRSDKQCPVFFNFGYPKSCPQKIKFQVTMTFLEALYGSQYQEITSKGRDGASGRLNGNLFLSAFVMITLFLMVAIPVVFSDSFEHEANALLHKVFGYSSGKFIGKLLAIPLIGIIYFIVSKTVGSESNYSKITQAFMKLPDEEKQKANMIALRPFFVVLGLLFALMMASLF
jgi:hypothetical protein